MQIAIITQAPIGTICFFPHLESRMRLPGIGETESMQNSFTIMRLAPQNTRGFSILPMHYIHRQKISKLPAPKGKYADKCNTIIHVQISSLPASLPLSRLFESPPSRPLTLPPTNYPNPLPNDLHSIFRVELEHA